MSPAPLPEFWQELFLILLAGGSVAVGLAALGSCLFRPAPWKRTIWQISFPALLAILLVELSGAGQGIVQFSLPRPEASAREAVRASWIAGEPAPSQIEGDSLAGVRAVQESPEVVGDLTGDSFSIPAVPFEAPAVATSPLSTPPAATSAGVKQDPPFPEVKQRGTWWPGIIWGAGALLLGGSRILASLLLILFSRRRAPCEDRILVERARRLAGRLEIRRHLRVKAAPGLSAPIAYGILRPTLGLPLEFFRSRDPIQQEVMLAHELGHLAAGDPQWLFFADLVTALFWWHPLVWWSRRRLYQICEYAADEASALVEDGPAVLATCLVELGRSRSRLPLAMIARMEGSGFRSSLGRRVKRLLNLESGVWKRPGRTRSCLAKVLVPSVLVIAAICSTAWARPRPAETQEKGDLEMKTVLKNHWKRSLASIALVAALGTGASEGLAQEQDQAEKITSLEYKLKAVTEELRATRKLLQELQKEEEKKNRKKEPVNPAPTPAVSPAYPPPASGRPFPSPDSLASLPSRAERPVLPTSGATHYVDLVNLATTVTDASAEVRIAKVQYERLKTLAKTALTSKSDLDIAAINYENAERKLALLRGMVKISLQAAEAELARRITEVEHAKARVEVGKAEQSSLIGVESQVAAAKANLELLQLIFSASK